MGAICSCFSSAHEHRFLGSTSESDPTNRADTSPATSMTGTNRFPSIYSNNNSERILFRSRTMSSGGSSVEVLDLESVGPLDLFQPSSVDTDDNSANSQPEDDAMRGGVRPKSSPASTMSAVDHEDGPLISLTANEVKDSLRVENEDENDKQLDDDEIDIDRAFVKIDSAINLEDVNVAENTEEDEMSPAKPRSPNSNASVSMYDSCNRLSVEMRVKYFHGLERRSNVETTAEVNASDRARAHVERCSPRILSAAQRFGDMADHMM